jgi:hypothetical protein
VFYEDVSAFEPRPRIRRSFPTIAFTRIFATGSGGPFHQGSPRFHELRPTARCTACCATACFHEDVDACLKPLKLPSKPAFTWPSRQRPRNSFHENDPRCGPSDNIAAIPFTSLRTVEQVARHHADLAPFTTSCYERFTRVHELRATVLLAKNESKVWPPAPGWLRAGLEDVDCSAP